MGEGTVAIVGGGVAGASCAYHLAEGGVEDVVVFEADHPASKASGRAGGFVTPDQFLATGSHPRAHEYLRAFWERLGRERDFPVHHADAYTLARTEAAVENLERLQAGSSVESEIITGPELAERVPDLLVDDVHAAFTFRDGAFLDPHLATTSLVAAAEDLGAEVVLERVTGLTPTSSGHRVETESDSHAADVVVLAAGAWSKRLGRTAGLDLPLKPRSSQIAMLEADAPPSLPLVNDPDLGLYYRSEVDGSVLIGGGTGTTELDPDDFSTAATESFLQEVAEKAPRLSRALDDARITSSWAGRCTATPDRHPLVGESSVADLYLCAGFNGEGIMYSAPAGRIVADDILGRQSPFDATPYRPDRFQTPVESFDIKSALDW